VKSSIQLAFDAGERLVVGRGQAGDRPVPSLGPARDWDAGGGVEAEDLEGVISLRAAEQFLEAGGVFEALFELAGLRAVAVGQGDFTVHPRALLLVVEELAQAFGSGAGGHATWNIEEGL
jgi:hypothetical protein